MLRNKDALYKIEMERITAEFRVIAARTEVAERAVTILERVVEARTEYDAAIDALQTRWKATLADLLNSTTLLAMMLSFETPERRQRALDLLTPAMVTITNAMIERIEASGEHPDFTTLRLQTLREIVSRWQELR